MALPKNVPENVNPQTPAAFIDNDVIEAISGSEDRPPGMPPRWVPFLVDVDRPREALENLRFWIKAMNERRPKNKGGAPKVFRDWVDVEQARARVRVSTLAVEKVWPEIREARSDREKRKLFLAAIRPALLPRWELDPQWAENALRAHCDAVRSAAPDDARGELMSAGFGLGQFVGAELIDRGVVESELSEAALTAGLDSEVSDMLRRCVNKGMNHPLREGVPERSLQRAVRLSSTNRRDPRAWVLDVIADALGISPRTLRDQLNRKEPPPKTD